MITDPYFYAAAIPAIILVGIAKGGFCSPLAMLGVPVLSLVISPIKAAAIMLPILICMDFVGLLAYRGNANKSVLKSMLPFALLGIGIGWLLAGQFDEHIIKFLVGLTALAFVADYAWRTIRKKTIATRGPISAGIWGTITGLTSFIAHSGGPPYQIHTLPLGMAPITYAATSVYFFTTMNTVKLVPYFALGQFSTENLWTTLVLVPLAPIGTMLGIFLVRKISQGLFYRFSYLAMFLIALKLCSDSLFELLA
ncbi:sulfite exporter TauE/SafE family protein [uncultured Cohaesibacter sp.]|uniref:sulfite exporter TauE/SafE family protein n=1 Tax=uncultured Cohaesibacter sp. TaxID=1002546 RepID=UPI0029311DA8|nr:sulfite exporter TauE/SafE family protein [uncultured Cohaesibacter sp.]